MVIKESLISEKLLSSKMSSLRVAGEPETPHRSQLGGGMAAIRRNTVMLARDVLLRRFSRDPSAGSPFRFSLARGSKFTLEEFEKLVHEVNHMIAAYRQLLQTVGTPLEPAHAREELSASRQQCLRTCDTAKNCILPQLKSETHDHHQSSELTKHASHQFIGCVNMFIAEMKRCQSLLRRLPVVSGVPSSSDETDASSSAALIIRVGSKADDELESLRRDLSEAEAILETLENAITVHFSIDPPQNGDKVAATPRTRKKGCQFGKICANFKTSYA